MLRATEPIACAMPSQTAATARPRPEKARETGPGPLRTARGAGRRAGLLEAPRLEVLRDRVLAFRAVDPDRDIAVDPLLDVLELRDPGGEDVRVAMVATLRPSHTSPRDHSRQRLRVVAIRADAATTTRPTGTRT
ncbi:MAG: hypothetical protein AVDCRST_MAG06-1528 [uncultured Nocardioides sp.]|uniref:Uncharacterized protein n=1 Tax=uncultured Nocardioides sp. TaxID=198441 RepID=A0A6J4NPP1_9ACTN|nr:MAG: hypothetical protein AVDCRST_MAG06-1528 [uncultured Nocardioides sp.]